MATITAAHQKAIADLYVALFNRAPDADGFGFWTQALANGASLDTIAQNFVTTPEARAVYPATQTAEQFVSAYYSTVLGRPIDANGLAFWTKLLQDSGGVDSTAARAKVVAQIVEIVNTPLPVKPADITDEAYALTFADRNAFKNKGEVAVYYAVEYKGNDLTLAKQVLAVVGPNTTTIDVAKELLNPTAPAPVSPVVIPVEFNGTTGADKFIAGSADTTFKFVIDKTNSLANTTLTLKDVITGGAGNDTLIVTTTGAVTNADFLVADSITGIETVVIKRTDGSAFSYTAGADLKSVTIDGGAGAANVASLAGGAKFTASNTTSGSIIRANYADTTAPDVTVSGVNSNYLEINTAATSLKLTSTGASSVLSGVNMGPQVASLQIVADAAFTTGYINGGSNTKVDISGTAAVNLGVLDRSSITIFDASENSGGLTATLHVNNSEVRVTGSKANDTITTGIVLLGVADVDAGGGTGDRLIVTDSAAIDWGLGNAYKNFEILRVNNGVTVDLDQLGTSVITAVEIDDGAGATGVLNLSGTQAAAVTIMGANGTGVVTIGVKNASNVGQIDTVKAALATAGSVAVDLTGLTLAGVEKLELTGNGTDTATTGLVTLTTANATSLDSIIVKNAGGASITVAGAHAATNLTIDASESAGTVTINAAAYNTATGATLKGGAGGDVLTGSRNADTIVGGAGNDLLVGDGVFNTTGIKEVQSIALTGNSINAGGYHLGNYFIAVTDNQDAATVGAAITGANKADFLLANSAVEDISYADGAFTITYKVTAGDVPLIVGTSDGATRFDPATAQEITRGTGGFGYVSTAAADILTGGDGNDTFAFAQNSSIVTAFDTITDLNLGTGSAAGQVDKLMFQNPNAVVSIVSLQAAEQDTVTAAGDLAAAVNLVLDIARADGATAQFTYDGDTFIVHNGDGNATFNNRSDFLVKVTGMTGTLDASDIELVGGIAPI